MRVLGIDPGYAIVGWGVVDYAGNRFAPVDYGAVCTDAGVPFERRLDEVYAGIKEVIERTRPEALAIEKLFYQHNQTTVIGVAEARGVILLAAAQCGVGLPTVLMGDKKFCDANPELVAKFLRVFLRSANMLQKETPESLAPEYCRFFQEFVGKSFTPEMAALDIKTHPVFNLEEQLALFDGSKGQSKAAKWMADIAEFFASVGRITPDELKVVKDGSYATDKFLKFVKKPIPDYK